MKCVVCQTEQPRSQRAPPQGWRSTSERAPRSRTRILFKLFELTKREFAAGSVCAICRELVFRLDELQARVEKTVELLKSRINCCGSADEYFAAHELQLGNSDGVVEEEDDIWDEEAFVPEADEDEPEVKRLKTNEDSDAPEAEEGKYEPEIDIKEEGNKYSTTLLVDKRTLPRPRPCKRPNLESSNLDFETLLTRTQRGQEQLIYKGYAFTKPTSQPVSKDLDFWKCVNLYANKASCKGKLNTTMDGLAVLLDSVAEHNHPPSDAATLNGIRFREKVRQMAENHPDMKPQEILASIDMLGFKDSVGATKKSILRYIQRARAKCKPKTECAEKKSCEDDN